MVSKLLAAELSGFKIAVIPVTAQLYNLSIGTQLKSYFLLWKNKTDTYLKM